MKNVFESDEEADDIFKPPALPKNTVCIYIWFSVWFTKSMFIEFLSLSPLKKNKKLLLKHRPKLKKRPKIGWFSLGKPRLSLVALKSLWRMPWKPVFREKLRLNRKNLFRIQYRHLRWSVFECFCNIVTLVIWFQADQIPSSVLNETENKFKDIFDETSKNADLPQQLSTSSVKALPNETSLIDETKKIPVEVINL